MVSSLSTPEICERSANARLFVCGVRGCGLPRRPDGSISETHSANPFPERECRQRPRHQDSGRTQALNSLTIWKQQLGGWSICAWMGVRFASREREPDKVVCPDNMVEMQGRQCVWKRLGVMYRMSLRRTNNLLASNTHSVRHCQWIIVPKWRVGHSGMG